MFREIRGTWGKFSEQDMSELKTATQAKDNFGKVSAAAEFVKADVYKLR